MSFDILPRWSLPTLFLLLLFGLWAAPLQAADQVRASLADGFDFPVGKPNAANYYKARGFRANVHLGEDWNGRGGGNTDLGDPVYNIADGIVVYSDDFRVGWGNVIIIRHAYRERGATRFVDSLYGHLNERKVRKGQSVRRGQLIGTIGSNRGMYWAHLHFEIRKNLNIGMRRSSFSRDYSNYYDPTDFIEDHRQLRREDRMVMMPVNTFGQGAATVSNQVKGNRLVLPVFRKREDTEETRTLVDSEIQRMLEKYQLGHGRRSGSTPEEPPGRTATRAVQEPTAEEVERNDTERKKIRSFWSRLKTKVSDGKVIESNEAP